MTKRKAKRKKRLSGDDIWALQESMENLLVAAQRVNIIDPSKYDLTQRRRVQLVRINRTFNEAVSHIDNVLFDLEDLENDMDKEEALDA